MSWKTKTGISVIFWPFLNFREEVCASKAFSVIRHWWSHHSTTFQKQAEKPFSWSCFKEPSTNEITTQSRKRQKLHGARSGLQRKYGMILILHLLKYSWTELVISGQALWCNVHFQDTFSMCTVTKFQNKYNIYHLQ